MKLTAPGKDSVLNSSYTMMPAYQPVDSGRSYGNDIADAVSEVMLKLKKGDSVQVHAIVFYVHIFSKSRFWICAGSDNLDISTPWCLLRLDIISFQVVLDDLVVNLHLCLNFR